MKMHSGTILHNVARLFSIGGLTITLLGCADPGYKKGNAVAAGVQDAAAQVQAEGRALDLTVGALRDLVNEPNGDLKQPYQHYCSSLDRFVTEAQRTENSGRRMAERNAAYLQAWDKAAADIEYQHVRELSQTRKSAVSNQFESVHQRYEESQAAVQPLITYLEDIRKALGTDLTAPGIESLKGVAQNADANAAKVQTALSALTAALNDSEARISSVAFQHTNAQAMP